MRKTVRHLVAIVDDDPSIRKLLQAFLVGCGYEVRVHADGQSVIDSFTREQPDVLLLDLQMPAPDGLAVLAALQGIAPQTPVVIISGSSDIAHAVGALRLGAWDYVTKPMSDLGAVHHAVQVALERAEIARRQRHGLQDAGETLTAAQAHSDGLTKALALASAEKENLRGQIQLLQNLLAAGRALDQNLTYQVDPAGNLLFVSEAVRTLGHDPASLVGRPVLDLIHPDDRALAEHRLTERRTGARATRRLSLRLSTGPEALPGEHSGPPAQVLVWAQGVYASDPSNTTTYAGTVGTMVVA
jgi:FixJ family two-component response regulator